MTPLIYNIEFITIIWTRFPKNRNNLMNITGGVIFRVKQATKL